MNNSSPNYYLQSNFGYNVIWTSRFKNIQNEAENFYNNYPLVFNIKLYEGVEFDLHTIPDLVNVERLYIKGIVESNTNYLLISDELANELTKFKCSPFQRYKVNFENLNSSIDLDEYQKKDYSLIVFTTKLNETTIFSETEIEIISLLDMSNKQTVKGYCIDLADFKNKQAKLIQQEQKMIKYKTYAIEGTAQIFGSNQNGICITQEVKDHIEKINFKGISILKNNDFGIRTV